jgi:hypothetical protein
MIGKCRDELVFTDLRGGVLRNGVCGRLSMPGHERRWCC